ncbi:hypothetical protein K4E_26020 [Enterococcus thailandicus]|nr:hypothetical protein K4E_26020 [Enterococcus thailandicus]
MMFKRERAYRLEWEKSFENYLNELDKQKPVIICGDLNVAHEQIDLKNWKTNQKNAGFTIEERTAFSHLLATGFTDTFRHFYPTQEGIYSWWRNLSPPTNYICFIPLGPLLFIKQKSISSTSNFTDKNIH